MILPAYRVAASTIPGAGQGVFLGEAVARGRILVAPDAIPRVHRWEEVLAMLDPDAVMAVSVRWFEDRYTVSPEWPDECYLNHSFDANGLWHLGFVFARARLRGRRITVDYRHLLGEGQEEVFPRRADGQPSSAGPVWKASRASTRDSPSCCRPEGHARAPLAGVRISPHALEKQSRLDARNPCASPTPTTTLARVHREIDHAARFQPSRVTSACWCCWKATACAWTFRVATRGNCCRRHSRVAFVARTKLVAR